MDDTLRNIARGLSNSNLLENSRKKSRRYLTSALSAEEINKIRMAVTSIDVQPPASFDNGGHHVIAEEEYPNRCLHSDDMIDLNWTSENGTAPTTVGAMATADYSVARQRHTGPRHGRGGRKRGLAVRERRRNVSPELTKVFARTLIDVCGGNIEGLAAAMKNSFTRLYPLYSWTTERERLFTDIMTEMSTGKTKEMYEVFPAPYFSLGEGGKAFCSCVGSTSFRITLENDDQAQRDQAATGNSTLCAHATGVTTLIEKVKLCLETNFCDVGKAIVDLYARRYVTPLATYIYTRPRMLQTHDEKIAVISEIAPGSTKTVQFIPVRVIQKGSGGYVCAFCDTVLRAGCHHTRIIRNIRIENEEEVETIHDNDDDHDYSDDEDIGTDEHDTAEQIQEDETNWNNIGDHKSYLPLSPVNCSKSLKVDKAVGECAMKGERYVLTAPSTCLHCNAHRNPKSLRTSEGVIMCTLGPCLLEMETYRCSNEECGRSIETEGRELCVLIDKCTAATHALLRRELIGVVMCNGTMNGRLRQYHSGVTSLVVAKIISAYPHCRSVRTLHRLCSVMLKLMVLDPDKSLFTCSRCDEGIENGGDRRGALCIDGINQGYVRRKQIQLQNISQPCSSVPASMAAFHGNSERPLNTLIRRHQTISVLLDVINGETINVDKKNVSDVVAVIRIVSPGVLPAQFCSHSICGRTFNDYYDDIGDNSVLEVLTKVTSCLFHVNTILYRLMKPLNAFLRKCASENSVEYMRSLGAIPRERPHVPMRFQKRRKTAQDAIDLVLHRLEGEDFPAIITNGVCWIPRLRGNTSDTTTRSARLDALRKIMDMFTMFTKGPITQFIIRSDIPGLRYLASLFKVSSSENPWSRLLSVMNDPSILGDRLSSMDTNLLTSCRIIRAAGFNIVQIERRFSQSCGRAAREGLGELLSVAARTVDNFYAYYDKVQSKHSAVQDASTWNKNRRNVLQDLMQEKFANQVQNLSTTPFQSACISGFYFPNHPQIRPLPFNTDEVIPDRELVPCTKNYEQNQKSYTPGSITVSCYCPNSITYGIKVLSHDEGTKSILDTVISRFVAVSEFVIYDFSCGLYQSAVHSLWRAIEKTRIVSDKFHAKNHTCSPGFFPNAYTALDHANTVAHEQRNRGIADLCKSLRNSSQQFYIGLLAYHTIVMNLRAKARASDSYETRDSLLSDYDLEWCYFGCLDRRCTCCQE